MDIFKYLLAPMLLIQEKQVRKNIIRLAPPDGPSHGIYGQQGPTLRVLVLGDSTGHSVGARTFEEAFISQFLHHFKGFQIEWHIIAKTGQNSFMAYEQLLAWEPKSIDVLITNLGVNDITGSKPIKPWLKVQRKIRDYATEQLGAKLVVVSGIMPIWDFPGLPNPLKWYIATRAKKFDKALRRQVSEELNAEYLSMDFSLKFDNLAESLADDGFHPGPPVYKKWGQKVASIVQAHSIMTAARFINNSVSEEEKVILKKSKKPHQKKHA